MAFAQPEMLRESVDANEEIGAFHHTDATRVVRVYATREPDAIQENDNDVVEYKQLSVCYPLRCAISGLWQIPHENIVHARHGLEHPDCMESCGMHNVNKTEFKNGGHEQKEH